MKDISSSYHKIKLIRRNVDSSCILLTHGILNIILFPNLTKMRIKSRWKIATCLFIFSIFMVQSIFGFSLIEQENKSHA